MSTNRRKKGVHTKIPNLIMLALASLTAQQGGTNAATESESNFTPSTFVDTNIWILIARGQPTNDIRLVARCLNPARRTMERSDVFFDLENIGQTNISWGYVAPPGFQRLKLQLYDASGKAVPHRVPSEILTNRVYDSFSELPKNKRGVVVGRMPLGTNNLVPFEAINLTNIFLVKPQGDFALCATGRMMKVNGSDGRLTILEIPPVTLPIHLRDGVVSPKQPASAEGP